jgi:hypothetical protein
MGLGDRVVPYAGVPFPTGKVLQPARQAMEGVILGSPRGDILLGQLQTVFLSVGAPQGVQPGDLFAVYRMKSPVPNAAGVVVAVPPERLGEALVIRATDQGSTAIVTASSQDFRVGDRVVLSQQIAP